MGYWQQIAVDNRRHRAQLERMDPRWRSIRGFATNALAVMLALVLWVAMLYPLIRWFL